jgi:hypothetical protein
MDGIVLEPEAEVREAAAIPLVIPQFTMMNSGADAKSLSPRLIGISLALEKLGWSRRDARELVRRSHEGFVQTGRPDASDHAILSAAISGRGPGTGVTGAVER